MPFDDYSSYRDEYEPERVRRIPPYYEEGLYRQAYEDGEEVTDEEAAEDYTTMADRE